MDKQLLKLMAQSIGIHDNVEDNGGNKLIDLGFDKDGLTATYIMSSKARVIECDLEFKFGE